MMLNGLRGIVNISLFFIFRRKLKYRIFEKCLFVSRMEKLLIRAVRAVCQDPGHPFCWELYSAAPLCLILSHPFPEVFLLSYCTKINQYLIVKSKCTLFLQSINKYLAFFLSQTTIYSVLLIII